MATVVEQELGMTKTISAGETHAQGSAAVEILEREGIKVTNRQLSPNGGFLFSVRADQNQHALRILGKKGFR